MAQSAPPPRDRDETESPALQLVELLERHGLENSLRDILEALEARRLGTQRGHRFELLNDFLLDGQPPLTEQELEEARREWQE